MQHYRASRQSGHISTLGYFNCRSRYQDTGHVLKSSDVGPVSNSVYSGLEALILWRRIVIRCQLQHQVPRWSDMMPY